MEFSNKHPAFNYQSEVNEICRPLFEVSEITAFNYAKFYNNDKLLVLTTRPDIVLEAQKRKKIQTNDDFLKTKVDYGQDVFYCLAKEDHLPSDNLLKQYNLGNSFSFNIRRGSYFECFCFLAPSKKQIISFYLNNLKFLRNFNCYFKDKAAQLIRESESFVFKINKEELKGNSGKEENTTVINDVIKANNYWLYHKNREVKITAREFAILQSLGKGRASKDTARLFNISVKTVDSYHHRLREKLEVHSSRELTDVYLKSELSLL